MVTVLFFGELVGVARKVEQRLSQAGLSAWIVPRSGTQSMTMRLPFLVAIGSIVLAASAIKGISGNDSR
jgi:hypothetical protein